MLRGRCHPAERSLFLQPYVDALRPVLLSLGAAASRVFREHTAPLVGLPELIQLVEARPGPRHAGDRAAVPTTRSSLCSAGSRAADLCSCQSTTSRTGAPRRSTCSASWPVDSPERVLLVGAVRAEAEATISRLSDRAIRLRLDPLSSAAVETLASSAGLAAHAAEVMGRTAGHSLSVVEYLRALAAGEAGVPASLAAAVQTRVAACLDGEDLVQGASVLHGRLDPPLLGDLVQIAELAAVRLCEELALAGL